MMGVGMPQGVHLEAFGQLLYEAFGHVAYHVGSSMGAKREWRDVDVRLMLPDAEYRAQFGDPRYSHMNAKWVALCMAFSALGKQMTGLPIDFQIQETSAANEEHHHPRSALLRQFKTPAEVEAMLAPAVPDDEKAEATP